VPDDRIKPTIKLLESAWREPVLDDPVAAVLPPAGSSVAVGYQHGEIAAFDIIGKKQWSHWGSSRCRAIAGSVDGSWTVYASYPEVGCLTARGHFQWAAPLEESYLRADHTAVATTLQGELTVAGTRRGRIRAFDMQGRQVFLLGEADADERTDGFQSRFGTIHAIAITPKADQIVVAAENEIAAFDTMGQQLWTSKDFPRVLSLAVALTEEPTFAVGTRDGVVAVLDKQGQPVWRAKADGYVPSVCFRGQTAGVVAASLGGTLTCYDAEGKAVWTQRSPVGFGRVACSLDGEVIAGAELAGRVLLFDAAGELFARTPSLPGLIRVMALSADGSHVFVGTSAPEIMLFKYRRPKPDEDIL
jgi:outer membrane protein assembly factor BamB